VTKPAIKIEHLSKYYELRHAKADGESSEYLIAVKDMLGLRKVEMHHVLDDISLDIQKGEILGVIGRNGCGKSTLLQILSNIIPPSSGTIAIEGTVCSILGIGAGFHPDLTGRENVYLNGSLLGMSKHKIDSVFAEIHNFSGIGEFIEEPVKNYSNGMYLRLAFSVFSHLDSDILLLDEVLAVGDAAFHEKAKQKITALARSGKTVVIVSHNPSEVIEFCTRCVLIREGKIAAQGDPKLVFADYLIALNKQNATIELSSFTAKNEAGRILFDSNNFLTPQNDFFRLVSVRVKASNKTPDAAIYISDPIEIEYVIEKKCDEGYLQLGSKILDLFGTWITTDAPAFREGEVHQPQPAGKYVYTSFYEPYFFNSGTYKHTLVIGRDGKEVPIAFQFYSFEIAKDEWIAKAVWGGLPSPLLKRLEWKVEQENGL
jgi:ABC-type polysaccharide/polyol phosphate transport system ATPase subunit